jgi:ligand-binding SRPBCC domain-containing protein
MARHLLERTSVIAADLAEVFAFFSAPENLAKITPPDMGFEIVNGPKHPVREGDRIDYRIRILGIPLKWRTLITSWKDGESFSDLQERGPYRYWHHHHTFRTVSEGVEMIDRVEYELPFGFLGNLFAGWFIRRQLTAIFDYRTSVIAKTFAKG